MFDGEYYLDSANARYNRAAVDTNTGFTEFIEHDDGLWKLRSLTNDLEKGTRKITVATAASLNSDWDIIELPQPNNKWVFTLEGNSSNILEVISSQTTNYDNARTVLNLYIVQMRQVTMNML